MEEARKHLPIFSGDDEFNIILQTQQLEGEKALVKKFFNEGELIHRLSINLYAFSVDNSVIFYRDDTHLFTVTDRQVVWAKKKGAHLRYQIGQFAKREGLDVVSMKKATPYDNSIPSINYYAWANMPERDDSDLMGKVTLRIGRSVSPEDVPESPEGVPDSIEHGFYDEGSGNVINIPSFSSLVTPRRSGYTRQINEQMINQYRQAMQTVEYSAETLADFPDTTSEIPF